MDIIRKFIQEHPIEPSIVYAILIMLLFLVLISFILTIHRVHALEKDNRQLLAQVHAGEEHNDELSVSLKAIETTLDKRCGTLENSLKFLNSKCEGLIDQIQAAEKRLDELHAVQEQFRNALQQNIPANQSTADAERLLRQGLSVDEVAEKTAIPKNEVEMIGAVHAIGEPQPRAPVVPRATPPAPPHPSAASASPLPEPQLQKSGPVASLRARSAYGISAKRRRPGSAPGA